MALTPFKRSGYVVAVTRKDGNTGYVSHGTSFGVAADISMAKWFDQDTDKFEILKWIDRAKTGGISRAADPATMRVMVHELTISELPEEDFEWQKAIRLHAVGKLTNQEAENLGLQAAVIERRMNVE